MPVNNDVVHDGRVQRIAAEVARLGHEVTVLGVTRSAQRMEATAPEGYRTIIVPTRLSRPPRGPIDRLSRFAWRAWIGYSQRHRVPTRFSIPRAHLWGEVIRRELRAVNPDIVHAHDVQLLGVAADYVLSARRRGLDAALIYDAHEFVRNMTPRPGRPEWVVQGWADLEARHIKHANHVITVAEPIARALRDTYELDVPVSVILNTPSPVASPASRSVREVAGVPRNVPLLVYSGGVNAERGLDVVVRSLPFLPDVHVAVVPVPWDAPQKRFLASLAEDLGVADRLHMCEPVDVSLVSSHLATATAGVSALRRSSETDEALPNKLFEYLHAGLPLVVSDCRAMADFVRRARVGEVFVDNDPESLAAAVRRLLASPPTQSDISRALSGLTWEDQVPVLRAAYNAVHQAVMA
jgi:glycosyltransferase involved in cell wall biosynthesis